MRQVGAKPSCTPANAGKRQEDKTCRELAMRERARQRIGDAMTFTSYSKTRQVALQPSGLPTIRNRIETSQQPAHVGRRPWTQRFGHPRRHHGSMPSGLHRLVLARWPALASLASSRGHGHATAVEQCLHVRGRRGPRYEPSTQLGTNVEVEPGRCSSVLSHTLLDLRWRRR